MAQDVVAVGRHDLTRGDFKKLRAVLASEGWGVFEKMLERDRAEFARHCTEDADTEEKRLIASGKCRYIEQDLKSLRDVVSEVSRTVPE